MRAQGPKHIDDLPKIKVTIEYEGAVHVYIAKLLEADFGAKMVTNDDKNLRGIRSKPYLNLCFASENDDEVFML